jgi:hypothetical protein
MNASPSNIIKHLEDINADDLPHALMNEKEEVGTVLQ